MKRGDTLIEVALAIGIFSLVAITVVSVVSASLTGAQSALETTVTREEIDAQAEALRFIHDSYVSGTQSKDIKENVYGNLWRALTSHALTEEDAKSKGILDYTPKVCSELYADNGLLNTNYIGKSPFIINTRQLNTVDPSLIIMENKPYDSRGIFYAPSTYPRVVYNDIINSDDFYSQVSSNSQKIKRVEGLYITVVSGKSDIVEGGSIKAESKTAYYDFYIHSCWMPPNTDRASTISTVVRLYDPAVVCYGANCSSAS
jgi:type II secretory pathway pseudopilin PulG